MAPLNEPDPNKRDISYLDQYAQERWDTVLHYLVGSSQQSGVSLDAVKILLHSGLMTTDSSDSSTHHITKAGFQFLLMETSSQVRKDSMFFFRLNTYFPLNGLQQFCCSQIRKSKILSYVCNFIFVRTFFFLTAILSGLRNCFFLDFFVRHFRISFLANLLFLSQI